jgi:hypothetical protein
MKCFYICNVSRSEFATASEVDGTQIHNEILIHMSQFDTFTFYIISTVHIQFLICQTKIFNEPLLI